MKNFFVTGHIPYDQKIFTKAVSKGKYKFAPQIFTDLTELIFSFFPEKNFPQHAILIPVPLHFLRYQKRGYNQSKIICDTIEKNFPEYQTVELVKRIKNTPHQSKLHKTQRQKNIVGAFEIDKKKNSSQKKIPKNFPLVIVDDVVTTGSTVQEIFCVLHAEGYTNVQGLTLGYA